LSVRIPLGLVPGEKQLLGKNIQLQNFILYLQKKRSSICWVMRRKLGILWVIGDGGVLRQLFCRAIGVAAKPPLLKVLCNLDKLNIQKGIINMNANV
jgi:hypothetical protein